MNMNYKKDKEEDTYVFKGDKRKKENNSDLTKKKVHLINFFIKYKINEKTIDKKDLIGITALLVHAARIDEKYTNDEKLILKFIERIDNNKDNERCFKRCGRIRKEF